MFIENGKRNLLYRARLGQEEKEVYLESGSLWERGSGPELIGIVCVPQPQAGWV